MLETSNCGRRRHFISTPTTSLRSLGTYLTRIKLPLRNYFKSKGNFSNYTVSVDFARMKRLGLKTKKLNGIQKVDLNKKKSIDYTEMAYREAVSKLKYLLAESYVSKPMTGKPQGTNDIYQFSNTKINECEEEIDDSSVIIDNFKTKDLHQDVNRIINPSQFGSCKSIYQTKAFSNLASSIADVKSVPPELNSFIEQQEEYIQQLQQESQFCRNQLTNLLHKVREVVAENEALHFKNKTGFFKCAIDEYTQIDENDNENNKQKSIQTETPDIKKSKILEGPNIVFKSRISELEAQLTQAKLELRKAQEENQSTLKRLSESCLNTDVPQIKTELEKALHEKYEAEMKMEDLQKSLALVRGKETEAVQKTKQTIDTMQQIEFEKNQCESEIKRLKEELDRQHDKLREATQEASRRIAEERQQVERRYSQQVEQLSVDLASHWDAVNKSQLESQKQRRELTELRRELFQKQAFIDDLKKELQNKISNLQSELNQALTEKDGAEQEVLATKLAAERSGRQSRQEQSRLQIEINSYKQRLERTEADLVHLRRENLRLSEQIASLEKEINISKSICPEDFSGQASSKLENGKELASMIMDMETKHEKVTDRDVTRVGKTTSTSNKKRTVKVDLKVKVIPKQKEEMAKLQSNIEFLSNKIHNTFSNQQGIASMERTDESLISYPHNMSTNSLTHVQSTTVPHTVHQEYSIKTNEFNEDNNKPLENDFFNEREKYKQDKNEDDEQKNVIDKQNLESYISEQQYNSYEQYNIMQNDQQEQIDAKQSPNDKTLTTHNLPQYPISDVHQNNTFVNSNTEFTQ